MTAGCEADPPRHWSARLWQAVRTDLFSRPESNVASLDGLRAIGVITISCFHCALLLGLLTPESLTALPLGATQWLFAGCWVGIDIFFVLSGFLIGRILLMQLQRGTVRFRAFYIRRTSRIFPAYYLVLTLSVFLFSRLDTFRPLYWDLSGKALLRGSWANYLYVSNYTFGRLPNALPWGWSLCVEEHFYLLLPALLAILFRFAAPPARVVGLLVLATLPLAARVVAFGRNPHLIVLDGPYYETHTHFDGLLLGVLIAYAHVYHRADAVKLVTRIGPALWILGSSCFVAVFVWGGLERQGIFPALLQFNVVALGSGLLLANGLYTQNLVARILAHPCWFPVARVSYGMYLVHPFALFWVLARWPGGQVTVAHSVGAFLAFTAAVLTIAFLCAAVLFLGLERTMLERGARLSRRYL